ncbi:HlyC/CorC family transporter [Natronospira bacteriovora]|uniref:Magnesium and cobalt efflux protein CorC n=1 Tax=Natronospira bacteriovora TaxID=3069753 RepID=A0ABU0W6P2_9GAMM|nr:transporter associated domain-containing protein [Natronospira sp. AB-CW4]MDQ2069666.1 transporter associated domain-containing protein [Natronospira sp. AB-CW4]
MSDDKQTDNDSNGIKGLFGRIGQAFSGEPRDRVELVDVLREAQRRELFDVDAQAMLEGVLEVSEMQVRDIMVPRGQMVVIRRDDSLEEVLKTVIESGHSRFPVIGENRDEVTGVVLAKDLLRYFAEGQVGGFNVREYIRPASFIPESKRLNVLLSDFRNSRNHMALVVDEYGGVSGLVTIEDVLEQIVGDIDDETDTQDDEGDLTRHSDTRFTVRALMPVEDFNEALGCEFSDEEFDTIGGLVTHAFGHLPKRGETTAMNGYRFRVLRADSRRIHLLEVITPKAVRPKSDNDD